MLGSLRIDAGRFLAAASMRVFFLAFTQPLALK
jgi:hypothetical protein